MWSAAFWLAFTFFASVSIASEEVPQGITLDGRLYSDSQATIPLADVVSLKIQILDSAQTCILYEETQSVNTTATSGYYTIQVGQKVSPPAGKRSSGDSNNYLTSIFSNSAGTLAGKMVSDGTTVCNFSPTAGDTRYMKFVMTPASDNVPRTTTTNLQLNSVPMAIVAERAENLRGFLPGHFLQVNGTTATLTQNNIESVFSTTNFANLTNLLATPAANYVLKNANGSAVIPSVAGAPGSGLAAGQIWYDSTANQLKYRDNAGTQTISTSAGTGVFANGGNAFSASAVLGTSDANSLNLVTNSTTRMSFDTSGNIGIGTTTPTSPLDISIPIFSQGLTVSSSTGVPLFQVDTSGGSNPKLSLNDSLGVNKVQMWPSGVTPSIWIDATTNKPDPVTDPMAGALNIRVSATIGQENGIYFSNASTSQKPLGAITGYTTDNATWGNGGLRFKTSNSSGTYTRMTIDNNGSVGVGIATPSAKTHTYLDESSSSSAIGLYGQTIYRTTGDSTAVRGVASYRSAAASLGSTVAGDFSAATSASTGSNLTNLIGVKSSAAHSNAIGVVTNLIGTQSKSTITLAGATATNAIGLSSAIDSTAAGTISDARAAFLEVNSSSQLTVANAYGLYVGNVRGTNNWSIFSSDSTAPSYFAGSIGIGTSSPSSALDLSGALTVRGISAPSAAPASQGRIYFDSTSRKFRVSEDAGTYVDLVGGGAASSVAASAGSVSTPSISFSADSDTGFYNSTANSIDIATGGSSIFNLSSAGLVSTTAGGGLVTTANGLASAPTFSFSGDPDTGLYSPATNSVALATSGTERLRVDSSGNVGIGTQTPSGNLHVKSTGSTTVNFDSNNSGSYVTMDLMKNGVGYSRLISYGSSDNTHLIARRTLGSLMFGAGDTSGLMTLMPSGNVGIGTTTPVNALVIERSSNSGSSGVPSINITNTNSADPSGAGYNLAGSTFSAGNGQVIGQTIANFGTGTAPPWSLGGGLYLTTRTNHPIIFGTGAAWNENMRITTAGNVGIGTTTPTSRLTTKVAAVGDVGIEVQNSAGSPIFQLKDDGFGYGEFRVNDNANSARFAVAGFSAAGPTISVDGTGGNTVDGFGGWGGIAAFITVPAAVGEENGIFFGSGGGKSSAITHYVSGLGGPGEGGLKFKTSNAGSPTTRMTINETGNVGIGITAPQAVLDVASSGTSSAIIVPRDSTANRPTTLVNGMIRYNSTTALFEFYQNGSWVNYTTVSDGRLKTNVTAINQGLDIVNQLNPVFFDWDQANPRAQGFGSRHQVGFIAQEVEKVLPEVVNKGEDSYRSVEYGKIVSVVVAAVKELYAKLIESDEKIQSLDRDIASVNAKLEADNLAKDKKIQELERRLEQIEKSINSK